MMRPFTLILILSIAALMVLQGFQCGSAEFTGAKLQIQQKNYDEAQRLLEQEVQKNPGNDEAWYLLGWVRGNENNLEGMNEAFNEAMKLSTKRAPDIQQTRDYHWALHLNAGVGNLERATSDSMNYYDIAVNEFKMAVMARPDTSLTYRYLGYAYDSMGDLDMAYESYITAWNRGKDVESLKRAGNVLIMRGEDFKQRFESKNAEPLKAIKDLATIKKGRRKTDVESALGAPDQIKRGRRGSNRVDYVYNQYNLTVTLEGDRVSNVAYSKPYAPTIDSTDFRNAQREFDKAISVLEPGKDTAPDDNELLRLLLRAYVDANRIEPAIIAFRAALAKDPENNTNRYILGVLLRTSGDYEGAIAQFKEAYERDNTYSDALFDLGATYYNWGVDLMRIAEERGESTELHKDKFREGLPYMERVAEQMSDDARVWETLGTIYAQLGMQDKAVQAFDRSDQIRAGNQ